MEKDLEIMDRLTPLKVPERITKEELIDLGLLVEMGNRLVLELKRLSFEDVELDLFASDFKKISLNQVRTEEVDFQGSEITNVKLAQAKVEEITMNDDYYLKSESNGRSHYAIKRYRYDGKEYSRKELEKMKRMVDEILLYDNYIEYL